MIGVVEKLESRRVNLGKDPTVELEFVVSGTSDDLLAMQALLFMSPTVFNGLWRQTPKLEPVHVDEITGEGIWNATVVYGSWQMPEIGVVDFEFDTTGGSEHITQSIGTTSSYGRLGTTPADHKGAIGVEKGDIKGVDVIAPTCRFSEVHRFAPSFVTQAYRALLYQTTGKVNTYAFRGCNPFECLFLGASGRQRGSELWEIKYEFAYSATKTGIQIGDVTVAVKLGWDYLWVEYQDEVDGTAKRLARRPMAAYCEAVYWNEDFSKLGIGA